MSSRKELIALFGGISACYLAYLHLLKLRKIKRKKYKLVKKKKFRRKKGQKAREEAQRKLKEENNDSAVEKKPKDSNCNQPPTKKQRLNESEEETSSSSSDDSSITESDDSSLISQSSDTESNSESDISSLTDDTFGNYDKNDNGGRIDDFDENEINEALAVKPEPYDDPLATTVSIIEKPNNEEEDIKPNVSELEEAMEIQNLNTENVPLSNILQVVRVKEEPNTM